MLLKNTVVDYDENGVPRTRSKQFRIRVRSEEFFAVYLEHVGVLFKLNATEIKILIYLCKKAKFDTGDVDITAADRIRMMGLFDVKKAAISKNINSLITKKILFGERGSFTINPRLFWKGSVESRNEIAKDITFEINYKVLDGLDYEDYDEEIETV